jgi:hypothetical protein
MSVSAEKSDVTDIVLPKSAIVKQKETISAAKTSFEILSLNDFLENIKILLNEIIAQQREKVNKRKRSTLRKNRYFLEKN